MAEQPEVALFGRRVLARRNALGMRQEELAKRIDRTRSSVANIEAGRQSPPLYLVEAIAVALDTTIAGLLATPPAPVVDEGPALDVSAAALYRSLDNKRMECALTWREVAAATRVSASTLTRLGGGGMTDVRGLARLLSWLGSTDLAPYIIDLDAASSDQIGQS